MLPSTQHLMPTITTRAGAYIKVGARPQAARPQEGPIKNKKGRKLSGARTAPYKAARPQAYANP